MLIKARLKGHEVDLLTLPELFRAGNLAVAPDDKGYCLSFAVPDELFRDGGGLHNAASVLLRRVNGVARMLGSDCRPVGLTGRFSDQTGRHHQVVLADSGRGTGPRQPSDGGGRRRAAPCTPSTGSGLCAAGPNHVLWRGASADGVLDLCGKVAVASLGWEIRAADQ